MKKWTAFLIFLFMNLYCAAPPTVNPTVEANKVWKNLYPKWDSFTMMQQEDRIRIYQLSENKDLWFPDSFAVKPKVYATIAPRNYMNDRIKTLLGNE